MRIIILSFVIFIMVSNCFAIDNNVMETLRGFSFRVYDYRSSDFSHPSFKFYVKTPDGEILGWDETKKIWMGTFRKSLLRDKPFDYPEPDQECTSNFEYFERKVILPSDINGGYSVNNALYCRNKVSGENVFISSGYSFGLNKAKDGKYEIFIVPDKNAILDFCYSFGTDQTELTNVLCTVDEFNKNLIITPNNTQTIEIFYNYTNLSENKIRKVVSPVNLNNEWESCYILGFIKNQGIYNSISKKLLELKKKYESGDIKTSTNIKNAVINEINAQYDKGIAKQCADILLEDLKQ
ncbi:MAG: hypothetical protein LLF28_04335 [Nitrospiraceae bacterium]|nr:hypothetical protein [Nitrospiraceae bacterium]